MNIIFISPNYPAGHRRYVAALTEAGHTVLGIGDAGDETFAPELRGALKGYYRVGDLHDHDSVYRACRYFEWQFGRIQKIESLNPYWRDLVEALRAEVCTSYACVEREYHHLIKSGIDVSALTPRNEKNGIVELTIDVYNQDGVLVLTDVTEMIVKRRREE